jgi:hypothetical protein
VVVKAFGATAVTSLCILQLASSAHAAWPRSVSGTSRLAADSSGRVYVAATAGSRPKPIPDKKPHITKVEIRGANWIYADGYLNMKVAVTNGGQRPARVVEVSFGSSQKRRVKPRPQKLYINRIKPGRTVTRNFKVTARRGSRGKAIISAYAGGKSDKARLKIIKPYW